jgi:hypothetical protein
VRALAIAAALAACSAKDAPPAGSGSGSAPVVVRADAALPVVAVDAADVAVDAAVDIDAAAPIDAPAPVDASPVVDFCERACTDYAGCYEKHYKSDFHKGGQCVKECEEMSQPDRVSWARSVATALRKHRCDQLFDD